MKPELFAPEAVVTRPTTLQADVVVIGAGPAGSAASSWLTRQGHSVVCLEASYFPRYVIGESLLPRCNELLEEAGLLEAVQARGYMVKHAAVFIRGGQRERFRFADALDGDWPTTFQVPRDDFDQTLATTARAHGVDIRFGHRVNDVQFTNDDVRVIARDQATGARVEVRAKFVIDCSGYGRVLSKLMGLERAADLPRRVACFTQVQGDIRPEGEREGDIWICALPEGGWSWVIPFSNGRTSIGVVCDPDIWHARSGTDAEKLMDLIQGDPSASRLAAASVVAPVRILEGYSKSIARVHGPRWVVAGNASDFLDPIFSSGVTLALESSLLASKLVHRQLGGEDVVWEREFAKVLAGATDVFRAFIESWYRDDLATIFFAERRTQRVKQRITSVLGGNVLRDDNPLLDRPEHTLSELHAAIGVAR